MHWAHDKQQAWDNLIGYLRIGQFGIEICPLKDRLCSNGITERGHIARHSAVAQRDEKATMFTDVLDFFEVFLAAHCPFDERDIHLIRELFVID
jgi:hypothetical protein